MNSIRYIDMYVTFHRDQYAGQEIEEQKLAYNPVVSWNKKADIFPRRKVIDLFEMLVNKHIGQVRLPPKADPTKKYGKESGSAGQRARPSLLL